MLVFSHFMQLFWHSAECKMTIICLKEQSLRQTILKEVGLRKDLGEAWHTFGMIMAISRSQKEARNKVGFQALSHSAQSHFASPIYTVQRSRKSDFLLPLSLSLQVRDQLRTGLEKGLKFCTDRSDAETSF